MRRLVLFVVLTALACLGLRAAEAFAAPGDLDPTFGSGGISLATFGPGLDKATDLVIQPDGRYLLTGVHTSSDGVTSTPTITRFNADGTLDPGFGTGGRLEGFGGSGIWVSPVSGNILLCDGAEVTRLLPDGTLDTSFGTNGSITLAVSGIPGKTLAFLPDGSMIVGSATWTPSGGNDIAIHRLSASGSIDSAFGVDGRFTLDMAAGSDDVVSCLAVAPDGDIVVGVEVQNQDAFLLRLTPLGSLDPQFGNGGVVRLQPSVYLSTRSVGPDRVRSKRRDPGSGQRPRVQDLWRYSSNGTPDTGWGACPNYLLPPGTVAFYASFGLISNGQGIVAKDMEAAANGSIILVGTKDTGYPTYKDLWLARINENGTSRHRFWHRRPGGHRPRRRR